MEKLSRDINILENRVARYIYIKYIQDPDLANQNITLNTTRKRETNKVPGDASSSSDDNASDASDNNDDDMDIPDKAPVVKDVKVKQNKKIIRPKVLDKLAYNLYRKNIFHQSRSCFILNQNDLIREDIQLMALADKAYEEHPAEFKFGNFDLPPDVLRCSFIRKHHHRYCRCRNPIMNKDSDICKKHENSANIYYDNYNDLLEKIGVA